MSRWAGAARRIVLQTGRLLAFAGYYGKLFLRANVVVAWEIVTPGSSLAPAVVELKLRCRSPAEVATLIHLINLTPGTLVVEDREVPPSLFVHVMHGADPAEARAALRHLEGRLLATIRTAGGP